MPTLTLQIESSRLKIASGTIFTPLMILDWFLSFDLLDIYANIETKWNNKILNRLNISNLLNDSLLKAIDNKTLDHN